MVDVEMDGEVGHSITVDVAFQHMILEAELTGVTVAGEEMVVPNEVEGLITSGNRAWCWRR
jgi:hypothetical protein